MCEDVLMGAVIFFYYDKIRHFSVAHIRLSRKFIFLPVSLISQMHSLPHTLQDCVYVMERQRAGSHCRCSKIARIKPATDQPCFRRGVSLDEWAWHICHKNPWYNYYTGVENEQSQTKVATKTHLLKAS